MPAAPASTVDDGRDGLERARRLGDRERRRDVLEPLGERIPVRRPLQPAGEGREHREHADRHEHRPRPLAEAALLVVVLEDERARLAGEDEEPEPERVEAGEERAGDPAEPEDPAVPLAVRAERAGRGDDRVLREEAAERRDADERERAREEAPLRERHELAEPAHLADVLLAGERVDREAGRHEEQRLEEGVRHEVEHPARVRPDPDAEEHVADLRHRRVRDHALDVGLDERDQPGDEERQRADAGRDQLDRPRLLEDDVRARDEVDAGGDHRRRVDEGADRRRAFHRVGQPGLERDLRRLRHGAAEQAERDPVRGASPRAAR